MDVKRSETETKSEDVFIHKTAKLSTRANVAQWLTNKELRGHSFLTSNKYLSGVKNCTILEITQQF